MRKNGFYGIHPDVIFGEARRRIEEDPYVCAMMKLWKIDEQGYRQMMRPARRAALINNPEVYGLTDKELAAVQRVAKQSKD